MPTTAKKTTKDESFVMYRTPLPVERAFDIPQTNGTPWRNFGWDKDHRLLFRIPTEDTERFERHTFFVEGRLEREG